VKVRRHKIAVAVVLAEGWRGERGWQRKDRHSQVDVSKVILAMYELHHCAADVPRGYTRKGKSGPVVLGARGQTDEAELVGDGVAAHPARNLQLEPLKGAHQQNPDDRREELRGEGGRRGAWNGGGRREMDKAVRGGSRRAHRYSGYCALAWPFVHPHSPAQSTALCSCYAGKVKTTDLAKLAGELGDGGERVEVEDEDVDDENGREDAVQGVQQGVCASDRGRRVEGPARRVRGRPSDMSAVTG